MKLDFGSLARLTDTIRCPCSFVCVVTKSPTTRRSRSSSVSTTSRRVERCANHYFDNDNNRDYNIRKDTSVRNTNAEVKQGDANSKTRYTKKAASSEQ